eukprot:681528-Pelagomonas_calceolata.AAC.1
MSLCSSGTFLQNKTRPFLNNTRKVSRASSHLRKLLHPQHCAAGCSGHASEGPRVPLVGLIMEQSMHYISAVLACLAAGCVGMGSLQLHNPHESHGNVEQG